MPQVMPLQQAHERQERVFLRRSLFGESWRSIAAAEGFTSVGGVQRAYKAHKARNPVLDAEAALEEIVERNRYRTGKVTAALAATPTTNGRTVAELVRAGTASDEQLAKLYGLETRTVEVRVSLSESLEHARKAMHAYIDAEVVGVKELER